MNRKINPLYDRLCVKRLEGDDRTAGGLYIPEGAKEKAQMGEVVSIGFGKLDQSGNLIPLRIKVGDIVFFGKYAGTDVDDMHLMLREDDVLGVVEQ